MLGWRGGVKHAIWFTFKMVNFEVWVTKLSTNVLGLNKRLFAENARLNTPPPSLVLGGVKVQ